MPFNRAQDTEIVNDFGNAIPVSDLNPIAQSGIWITQIDWGSLTTTSGTLTAVGQSVSITGVMKYSTVSVQIDGGYNGFSAIFEASIDTRNKWLPCAGVRSDGSFAEQGPNLVSQTLRGWEVDLPVGSTDFRIRTTAITSGTVSVWMVASSLAADPLITVVTSGTTLVQNAAVSFDALTAIQSTTADILLLQVNPVRKGATVYNDSPYSMYLLVGSGVTSNSNYTVQLAPLGYYEVPFSYVGSLRGLWTTASGFARMTEFT